MKIFILILLPFSLISKEFNISSKGANFDGEKINITGKVILSHPLGKIEADNGYIKKIKNKKNFFSLIYLNQASLLLNKGKITSKKAIFEKETKKIKFLTDVKYTEKDLNIKSKKAECFSTDLKNFKISFLKNVFFNYQKLLKIKAEKIFFIKDEITFFANSKNLISFKHKNIKADATFAKFIPKDNSFFLKNSKGIFYFEDKDINFSANQLFLNKEKAVLNDNAILIYNPYKISSSKIEFFYNNQKIEKIISYDNSNLYSPIYKIFSKNPITFNLLKNTIYSKGDIYFFKDQIKIYAQKALIKTKAIKNKLEIKKIELEKNVSFIKKKDEDDITLALSDKIKFNPFSNSIKLESYKDNKVLFWQSKNDFSLSAKKIKIFFKENEKIQGYGKVRFSLNPPEKILLQKTFEKFLNNE